MNTALLLSALVMGLAGSLHCAGMCGPIVWMMPFHQDRGWRRAWSMGQYHVGRLSAYACLGLVLFSFKELFHPQWQQYVSLAAGLLLLALGVFYFLPQLGLKVRLPWTGVVTRALGMVLTQRRKSWLLAAGVLNGLLPCGMVYMALAAALNMETAWQATAVMYSFGVGTLPMMISLSLLRGKMRLPAMSLRKWTPVIMLLFGCLFVLRGANLGIPYLSPKLEIHAPSAVNSTPTLKCCQKAE